MVRRVRRRFIDNHSWHPPRVRRGDRAHRRQTKGVSQAVRDSVSVRVLLGAAVFERDTLLVNPVVEDHLALDHLPDLYTRLAVERQHRLHQAIIGVLLDHPEHQSAGEPMDPVGRPFEEVVHQMVGDFGQPIAVNQVAALGAGGWVELGIRHQRIRGREKFQHVAAPVAIRVSVVAPQRVAQGRVAHRVAENRGSPVQVIVIDDHRGGSRRLRLLAEEIARLHPELQLLAKVAGIGCLRLQGVRQPRLIGPAVEGNLHVVGLDAHPPAIIANPSNVDVRAAHAGGGRNT